MQPTGILSECAALRDRHCQEQCVEARIVESFAEVTPGGDNDALFVARDGRQPLHHFAALLLAPPTPKHDDMLGKMLQSGRKRFKMIRAFREHNGRPRCVKRMQNIIKDERVQLLI
jgi:hypothetical protein